MHPISRSIKIKPRDEHFHVQEMPRRDWHGGDPVKSIVFNAFSLMFPEGERFFIDSVKAVRSEVTDPILQEQIKGFIKQESVHTREHIDYNVGLEKHGFRANALNLKVRKMRQKTSKMLSRYRCLAASSAMEHLTANMAELLLSDDRFLKGADEQYSRMWRWHALEEIEHKGVVYDVFAYLALKKKYFCKGYFVRVRAMLLASAHFNILLSRHIRWMMKDAGLSWSLPARCRLIWFLYGRPGVLRRMVPLWFQWFVPGFHPWQDDNRFRIEQWEKALSQQNASHANA